jgi:hypothetical protein
LHGDLVQPVPQPGDLAGQAIAIALVLGSYFAAQYLRVLRPRKLGRPAARVATRVPNRPADLAVAPPAL